MKFFWGIFLFLFLILIDQSSQSETGWVIDNFAGNAMQFYLGENTPATSAEIRPYGLWGDSNGNLYIGDNTRIAAISASGLFSTVVGTPYNTGSSSNNIPATSAVIGVASKVWADTSGNIFYLDSQACTIRLVDATTKLVNTVIGSSCSTVFAGEFIAGTSTYMNSPTFIYGNSMGVIYFADTNNHRIRKYTVSTLLVNTIAGNGTAKFSGDGGPATSATLNKPIAIFVDTNGNIFIGDNMNKRIRRILKTNGIINTVVGSGSSTYSGNGLPATSTGFGSCQAIYVDTTGTLYFSDTGYSVIRKVSGGIITTFAGFGSMASSITPGPATSTGLGYPYDVWGDTFGNIFISDLSLNYVFQVSTAGTLSIFTGNGLVTSAGDGGPATSSQISYPTAMAMSVNGMAYIADSGNCKIRLIDTNGIISTLLGTGNCSPTADGTLTITTSTAISQVYDIVTDTAGVIYFIENHRVKRLPAYSNNLATIVGGGSSNIEGLAGLQFQFSNPKQLWVDTSGNIYVVDVGISKVKLYTSSDTLINTFAGTGYASPFNDHVAATSCNLNGPFGVWGDSLGSVYVSETSARRIRKITGGIVMVIAGTGAASSYINNYWAIRTDILNPQGITGDSMGNIYVADKGSYRIQMLSPFNSTTYTITTIAGNTKNSYLPGFMMALSGSGFFMDVAIDTNGKLYTVENSPDWVRVLYQITFPSPTSQPSCQPTSQPSQQPVGLPTGQPTRQPVLVPTAQPSRQPTSQPTRQPVSCPTGQPSRQPTSQPTRQPIGSPSAQPSRLPTGQPSSQPSSLPSAQPSCLPTSRPSSQPSSVPSAQPISLPTRLPTGIPSTIPSSQPTSCPSSFPTTQPSGQPSQFPSSQPSSFPSSFPSGLPTNEPTNIPTGIPSCGPSVQPTCQPTCIPSCTPSSFPSSTPTNRPSSLPTVLPTCQPTSRPSATPSTQPTSCPSSCPSTKPSAQPFSFPSSAPSSLPSAQPSVQPSGRPTNQPSGIPSRIPSSIPSTRPSRLPSGIPSALPYPLPSTQPTCRHTTLMPTSRPSYKNAGSSFPTTTAMPSVALSPTVASNFPSMDSTSSPSTFPSRIPSISSAPSQRNSSSQPISNNLCPTSAPVIGTSSPTSQSNSPTSRNSSSAFPSRASSDSDLSPSLVPSVASPTLDSNAPSIRPTAMNSTTPSVVPTAATAHPSSASNRSEAPAASNSPTALISKMPTPSPSISSATKMPTKSPTTSTPSTFRPTAPLMLLFKVGHPSKSMLFLLGSSVGISDPAPLNNQPIVKPSASDLTLVSTASSYLLFGSTQLPSSFQLTSDGSTTINDDFIHLPSPQLYRDDTRSHRLFVEVGDINRDGSIDQIACYPLDSICYGFLGSNHSSSSLVVSFTLTGELHGSNGAGGSDNFGWSVAALGDVNEDNYHDFIVCAKDLLRRCYVIFGRRRFSSVLSMSTLSYFDGFKIFADDSIVEFGLAVSSAGDFNGDGFSDLVVSGLSMTSIGTEKNYSFVSQVILGSGERFSADVYLGNATSSFVVTSPMYSFAGLSLSGVGDVNGDGFDDIIIGSVPYQGGYIKQNAFFVLGRSFQEHQVIRLDSIREDSGVIVVTGGGFMVSGVGDVNGDGLADLMVVDNPNWIGHSNNYLLVFPSNVTSFPTIAPSLSPTTMPSPQPTSIPTTSSPSFQPTPSKAPSWTSSPTNQSYSSQPSPSPSTARPQSTRPSNRPIISPTLAPSRSPSRRPITLTASPTLAARTISPSTRSPSRKPSNSPMPSYRPPTAAPTTFPSFAEPADYEDTIIIKETGQFVQSPGKKTWFIVRLSPHLIDSTASSLVQIIGANDASKLITFYPYEPSSSASSSIVTVIVQDFHEHSDLLDFTYIPGINDFADLSYQTNPLQFILSDHLVLQFTELDQLGELSTSNLIFRNESSSTSASSSSSSFIFDASMQIAAGILFTAVACVGLCACIQSEDLKKEGDEVDRKYLNGDRDRDRDRDNQSNNTNNIPPLFQQDVLLSASTGRDVENPPSPMERARKPKKMPKIIEQVESSSSSSASHRSSRSVPSSSFSLSNNKSLGSSRRQLQETEDVAEEEEEDDRSETMSFVSYSIALPSPSHDDDEDENNSSAPSSASASSSSSSSSYASDENDDDDYSFEEQDLDDDGEEEEFSFLE